MKTRRIRKSDGRYLILYEFPAPKTGLTTDVPQAGVAAPRAATAKAAAKPRPKP